MVGYVVRNDHRSKKVLCLRARLRRDSVRRLQVEILEAGSRLFQLVFQASQLALEATLRAALDNSSGHKIEGMEE